MDSLRETVTVLTSRKSLSKLSPKFGCLDATQSTTASTNLNGIFDDESSIVVCDAVVSFLSRAWVHDSFVSVRRRKLREILCESIDFWLLLVSCHTGDLEEVRVAYERLQQHMNPSASTDLPLTMKLTCCLHVAAREGHETIMKYLLDIGADPKLEGDQSVRPWPAWGPCSALETSLMAAAENGHVHIMELLLPLCRRREASRIKRNILFLACKLNILPVAQFVLATGSVRVYGRRPLNAFGNPVTIAADHGHMACVQLVLQNQPSFSAGTAGERLEFLETGALSMKYANNLDMLKEIIPHLDKKAALLYGTGVDGGVQVAIQLRGPYDLEEEYKHYDPSHEDTLGAEALQRSVQWGRVENVRYLLGLGVKITKGACMCCSVPRGRGQDSPSLYDIIPRLFADASHHPPVRIDRHWLWLYPS